MDADRRQTLLGERIMLAAPALAGAAKLVRSSHERIEGTGYPDGLRGEEIPLGARIIFVCGAFDAMIGRRPSRADVGGRGAGRAAPLRRVAVRPAGRRNLRRSLRCSTVCTTTLAA